MKTIRLQGVPEHLHKSIIDILDFECKTAPEFIKPVISDIINEYPEEIIEIQKQSLKKHIQIRGVSPNKYKKLSNIASHLGITVEQLIRLKLQKIVDEYPINLR